jgi:predicted nucleic-acid-binding Zn-ribbon protein
MTEKMKCTQCDRFFKSEIALEHHVLSVHDSQSVMFLCKSCGMSQSGDLQYMRKHISEQH